MIFLTVGHNFSDVIVKYTSTIMTAQRYKYIQPGEIWR